MKTTPISTLKYHIVVLLLLFSNSSLFSQEPFTVSTFHNLSVYWSPSGGSASKKVLVQYKKKGSSNWKEALSMKYNPIPDVGINKYTKKRYDKADYRGSIVNLSPNVIYEIKLTLEGTSLTKTVQAKTWSEDFPIAQTITPADSKTMLKYYYNLIGSPNGYILIDGTGSTIDIQDNSDFGIELRGAQYVIVRGFKIINAKSSGIKLFDCKRVIIEDCDISKYGSEDVAGTGFGRTNDAGIVSNFNGAIRCVFQRNKIHHPNYTSNDWSKLHNPNKPKSYHPDGPQGIKLARSFIGNNVVRYNEFWSDKDHYFNDVIGGDGNTTLDGFPGSDSDIYGNYIANSWDDGIEAEGGGCNVRVYDNYIENTYIAIGNAPITIGPTYVWKNVSGKSYTPLGGYQLGANQDFGYFAKLGYASSASLMKGEIFMFNNTILQPSDSGYGGFGIAGWARIIRHTTTKNNIIHVRAHTKLAISDNNRNENNSFDYDLSNKPFPSGYESNGFNGKPTYSTNFGFNFSTKTGNFQLAPSSLGYDQGEIIPNFTDNFKGLAPDVGAHENGMPSKIYGIKAGGTPQNDDTEPPTTPTNLVASGTTESITELNWTASTDNQSTVFYDVYINNSYLSTVSNKTSYIVINLEPNKAYNFKVKAKDAAGNVSDFSNTVTITTLKNDDTEPPTTPTNLVASGTTENTTELNWTASTDNQSTLFYDIYLNNSYLTTVSNKTSYIVTNLEPNKVYNFKVKAKDAAGNVSNFSNTVTITTLKNDDTEPPTTPTNLVASGTTENTTELNWTASTDNQSTLFYDIYLNNSYLTTVSNKTSYIVTNLEPNKVYNFKVKAKDAAGNVSNFSNTVTITTLKEVSKEDKIILITGPNELLRGENVLVAVQYKASSPRKIGLELKTEDNSYQAYQQTKNVTDGTGTEKFTFTVPKDAPLGKYRYVAYITSDTGNWSNKFDVKYEIVEVLDSFDETVITNQIENIETYPNPIIGDFLTIVIPKTIKDVLEVKLISITGKLVLERKINTTNQELERLDVSNLRTGVYFIEIRNHNNLKYSKKIIIE